MLSIGLKTLSLSLVSLKSASAYVQHYFEVLSALEQLCTDLELRLELEKFSRSRIG